MPDGTWKREGPPIMMVSLDSARQWYPREEFVACNADHIHIAKLKRGENSIYPSVQWAIKKALLSAGDLYSEANGTHYGESRNLQSAYEASAVRPSLLQVRHRQISIPSDDRIAGLASAPSRVPSEDTMDQQIRRLEVEKSANRGDTQSKSNPFNNISQWCSGVDVSKCDDIQSSTSPKKTLETDQASILFDEDHATSKGTDFTTFSGEEVTSSGDTRGHSNPDPARKGDDENWAPQIEDSNVSTNGTKSMILDKLMESAITEGDEAKTRELLAHSYDVNCRDDDGMTPLLLAAGFKHENILRLLLERGAHPRVRCCKGKTTLHWLTMNSSTHITENLIDLLLRNRPPFEVADSNGKTPLMAACTSGDLLLAERLIRHGADLHATPISGLTALHCAAYNGRAPMISILLDYGAELEVKSCQGVTPLHSAASGPFDSSETVGQLIRAGANKEATCLDDPTRVDGRRYVDSLFRPLHLAIKRSNKACVTYLLESGANIEAPTNWVWRPLHFAAEKGRFVKAILDHGADIEAPNRIGCRPLHYAAKEGQLEAIKALLDHGADIEAPNKVGRRPLHYAAKEGQLEAIKALLDHGAYIEAPDKVGRRPLHDAAEGGQLEAIKALLDHGADIEAPDPDGKRPLHIAAREAQLEAVKLLLDHGANPTARTSKLMGDKPSGVEISSSVSNEQRQVIRKLLKEAEKTWKESGRKADTGSTQWLPSSIF